MKHEMSLALVALVTPATGWWRDLSPLRKAVVTLLTVAAAAFSIGAGTGAWGAQALELPNRVEALESQIGGIQATDSALKREIEAIRAEHRMMALYREENTCMLKRLMCRLDGDTANICDLRYAVRAAKCPGG